MGVSIVNVGCGPATIPGAVNVDRVAAPGVDVVWDLDVTPWPFDDAAFDELRAVQVFEHVGNPIGFMVETHRVLRSGGRVWMTVPHYQSPNSFTDPTHVRHCTERTWDYWCEGEPLWKQFNLQYGGVTFRKVSVVRVGDDLNVELMKP